MEWTDEKGRNRPMIKLKIHASVVFVITSAAFGDIDSFQATSTTLAIKAIDEISATLTQTSATLAVTSAAFEHARTNDSDSAQCLKFKP